jgi:hypothetical protein
MSNHNWRFCGLVGVCLLAAALLAALVVSGKVGGTRVAQLAQGQEK